MRRILQRIEGWGAFRMQLPESQGNSSWASQDDACILARSLCKRKVRCGTFRRSL